MALLLGLGGAALTLGAQCFGRGCRQVYQKAAVPGLLVVCTVNAPHRPRFAYGETECTVRFASVLGVDGEDCFHSTRCV